MADVDTTVALVSLTNAKAYLKIPTATTSEDAILINLVNEASVKVSDYIGRNMLTGTKTEYYNGEGVGKLRLKNFPITAVTTLHDDTEREFGADTLIDASDYYLHADEGMIELLDGVAFVAGQLNVKVVYVAGYALASIPYAIQDAVKRWVADAYMRYNNRRHGVQSESIGDKTITFSVGDIPADVKFILKKYRDSSLLVA